MFFCFFKTSFGKSTIPGLGGLIYAAGSGVLGNAVTDIIVTGFTKNLVISAIAGVGLVVCGAILIEIFSKKRHKNIKELILNVLFDVIYGLGTGILGNISYLYITTHIWLKEYLTAVYAGVTLAIIAGIKSLK